MNIISTSTRRILIMKNKFRFVFIPLVAISLMSCHRVVDELYPADKYETSSFEKNWYYERGNFDREFSNVETTTFNISKKTESNVNGYDYHNALRNTDGTVTYYTDEEKEAMRENYPENPELGRINELREEDQVDSDGNILRWDYDEPNTDMNGKYGPYNSLYNNNPSFCNGYVSKLYDGRTGCDGFVAKSRIQIDKRGIAAYFPKLLSTYKYFAVALRGATEDGNGAFAPTDATNKDKQFPVIDFHLSFGIHSQETNKVSRVDFNIKDYPVKTNDHNTALLFFYFDEVCGEDWESVLKDAVAMSITFDLKDQTIDTESTYPYVDEHGETISKKYKDVYTDDATIEKDKLDNENFTVTKHFAIMLYEVMLPGSTWY